MPIDPSTYDSSQWEIDAALQQEEKEKKLRAEQDAQAAQQAQQDAALAKDPHAAKPPEQFGVKENLTEAGNALVGGLRDTVSSFATAPERYTDMVNGQMAQAGDQYKPDWDPLGGDKNPINKTWWGGMLRSFVHFGSTSAAILGTTAAAGLALRKGRGDVAAKELGLVGRLASNTLVRGAAVGAAADAISEYSQGDNIAGTLYKSQPWFREIVKHNPVLDSVFVTHDGDHPLVKTLKNVTEGMGIGLVFDLALHGIGKAREARGITNKPDREIQLAVNNREAVKTVAAEEAARVSVDQQLRGATAQYLVERGIDFNKLDPTQQLDQMAKTAKRRKGFESWTRPNENNVDRAARKAEERSKSVEDQTVDKAEVEMEDPNFRGHKNKPIADPWQGSPNSTGSAYEVAKDLNRIDTEWGAETGSTSSVVTPAAAERMASTSGIPASDLDALARSYLGDARVDALHQELRAQRLSFDEIYGRALERHKEVLEGRDTTDMTPKEFWESFYQNQDVTDGLEYWATREVVAADLINGSLFKQIRDIATASREIHGIADVMDTDGPMKTIRDRLIVGLTNVKRSRFLASQGLSNLRLTDPQAAAKQTTKRLSELHGETVEAVDTMMQLAKAAPTDDFLQAVLEAFSMSNKISNFDDLDKWMRGRLVGMTTEDGIKHTGALIKELQGVMVHSILSGPKTPVRAVLGTGVASFLRPLSSAIGGALRNDGATLRSSLASAHAMFETIPEALQLFKSKLGSYWSGDISTVKTRFSEYSPSDAQWELMGHLIETRGSDGEKLAYNVTNIARKLNDNSFLTYSTKLMAATDDAFELIMGRARARELALREALDMHKAGDVTVVNRALIKEYEDRFMQQIFNSDGSIKDEALNYAQKEVTLTQDLSGFAKGLDQVMSAHPWTKPFYLFAKTGVNGMTLSAKHTPLLGAVIKESREILLADPNNLEPLLKYGIKTTTDLDNAKSLILGRQAIGTALTMAAVQHAINGNLRGDGPANRQEKAVWEMAGWKPRQIKIGDTWVPYEAFEPFNVILASIGTIVDNSHTMGPAWTEQNLQGVALTIAQAAISKSYLSGLSSFMDLFSNDPTKWAKVGAGLMNNQIPLGGLRNEIGKVLTPYTRELNAGIWDSLRNRNLGSEFLAGADQLPIKYDILTGKPINDWDLATRMVNMINPVPINWNDATPGQTLLQNSNYDLKLSVLFSPTGVPLKDSSKVRSLYMQALGRQGIGAKLDKLAARTDVQASVEKMMRDIDAGQRQIDPMKAYLHNDLISNIFKDASYKAWAEIQDNAEVKALVDKKMQEDRLNYNTRQGNTASATDAAQNLIQLTNK